MSTPSTPPPPEEDPRATLQLLGYIMGTVMAGMTLLAYFSIAKVEAAGGGKMNILVALPYRMGGKALALGLFVAGTVACFAVAVYMGRLLKRDRER